MEADKQKTYCYHIIEQYLTNISPYKKELKPQLLKAFKARNKALNDVANDRSCLIRLIEFTNKGLKNDKRSFDDESIKIGRVKLEYEVNSLNYNDDIIEYILKMYDKFFIRYIGKY